MRVSVYDLPPWGKVPSKSEADEGGMVQQS